jgi:K+-sensing histidine kinase KdpD
MHSRSSGKTASLRPKELEAVYAISRIVVETLDFEKALAEIVRLARTVFIFDNAVLYLLNEKNTVLEPAFARALGRGRSSEADSAWGEMAAQEAYSRNRNYLHQPEVDPKKDRMDQRFYLGIPLLVGGRSIGALVFIRFGGPQFTEDQINLAEFITAHVGQVLEHNRLVERISKLEADRRLARLQSDFIATVSHELKTPLGFIKGYSTTLLRKDTQWNPTAQAEFLEIIDEETDRLTELVDNLLDSSRLQAGVLDIERKTVDLVALVDENVERLRVRYPELEIDWKSESTDSLVEADPKRLSQVIENLVSNAVKYAPGSPVRVAVKNTNGDVQISIKDEGPGVAERDKENIFKRFFRSAESKENVRGSGLGLYICEQIIHAHGGAISVISSKNEGAEFLITLTRQLVPEPA